MLTAVGSSTSALSSSFSLKAPLAISNAVGRLYAQLLVDFYSRSPHASITCALAIDLPRFSLFNVYNALFLGKPTTTKFITVYGEETDTKVYEVPIGASMTEVLRIAGMDIENCGHLSVVQGGPYLNEMAIEELGTGDDAYVRNTTNALLLIRKGATPYKEYADIKTEPPKEGLVSLVGKISGIHLPLGGAFLEPAEVLVSEGDEVEYEQKIGEPVEKGFSVGVWASAGDAISSVDDELVAISGGAMPQEEAEAEAEAEASR